MMASHAHNGLSNGFTNANGAHGTLIKDPLSSEKIKSPYGHSQTPGSSQTSQTFTTPGTTQRCVSLPQPRNGWTTTPQMTASRPAATFGHQTAGNSEYQTAVNQQSAWPLDGDFPGSRYIYNQIAYQVGPHNQTHMTGVHTPTPDQVNHPHGSPVTNYHNSQGINGDYFHPNSGSQSYPHSSQAYLHPTNHSVYAQSDTRTQPQGQNWQYPQAALWNRSFAPSQLLSSSSHPQLARQMAHNLTQVPQNGMMWPQYGHKQDPSGDDGDSTQADVMARLFPGNGIFILGKIQAHGAPEVLDPFKDKAALIRHNCPYLDEYETHLIQRLVNAMSDMRTPGDSQTAITRWEKVLKTSAGDLIPVCVDLLANIKFAYQYEGKHMGNSKSANKYSDFNERFTAVEDVLRTQKVSCCHIMGLPYVWKLAGDPIAAKKLISENRKVNGKKKEAIEEGRRALGIKCQGKGRPSIKTEPIGSDEGGSDEESDISADSIDLADRQVSSTPGSKRKHRGRKNQSTPRKSRNARDEEDSDEEFVEKKSGRSTKKNKATRTPTRSKKNSAKSTAKNTPRNESPSDAHAAQDCEEVFPELDQGHRATPPSDTDSFNARLTRAITQHPNTAGLDSSFRNAMGQATSNPFHTGRYEYPPPPVTDSYYTNGGTQVGHLPSISGFIGNINPTVHTSDPWDHHPNRDNWPGNPDSQASREYHAAAKSHEEEPEKVKHTSS